MYTGCLRCSTIDTSSVTSRPSLLCTQKLKIGNQSLTNILWIIYNKIKWEQEFSSFGVLNKRNENECGTYLQAQNLSSITQAWWPEKKKDWNHK